MKKLYKIIVGGTFYMYCDPSKKLNILNEYVEALNNGDVDIEISDCTEIKKSSKKIQDIPPWGCYEFNIDRDLNITIKELLKIIKTK